MKSIYGFILMLFWSLSLNGQSTVYVLKGGLTLGSQKMTNSQRQVLIKPHGAIAIESLDNEDDHSAIYAQLGYHQKGSSNRFNFFIQGTNQFESYREEFIFNNLSLVLGAKKKKDIGEKLKLIYFGGIRGDYTLSTNIDDLADKNIYARYYYPQIGAMNRWMVGMSAGTGLEFKLRELVGVQVELSVNPDFTLQVNQPALNNVIIPGSSGTTTIPANTIRNLTIELSVGLRLIRKVVYE